MPTRLTKSRACVCVCASGGVQGQIKQRDAQTNPTHLTLSSHLILYIVSPQQQETIPSLLPRSTQTRTRYPHSGEQPSPQLPQRPGKPREGDGSGVSSRPLLQALPWSDHPISPSVSCQLIASLPFVGNIHDAHTLPLCHPTRSFPLCSFILRPYSFPPPFGHISPRL